MTTQDVWEPCWRMVEARTGLPVIPTTAPDGFVSAAHVDVTVRERFFRLWICLDKGFPRTLPVVSLPELGPDELIPHVASVNNELIPRVVPVNHMICLVEEDSVVLNRRDAPGVICAAIHRACAVLERGTGAERYNEFAEEFETYWGVHPTHLICGLLYAPLGREPCVLIAQQRRWLHQHTTLRLLCLDEGEGHAREPHTFRGLFVPLRDGAEIAPPRSGVWTEEEARRHVQLGTTPAHQDTLQRLTNALPPQHYHFLLFGLPRSSGAQSLFGVWFGPAHRERFATRPAPLSWTGSQGRSRPVHIFRRDRAYLVERGGGMSGLDDMHVMIVGCGSVGGTAAELIAQLGVGKLTLVDPDLLHDDNIHRHTLGHDQVGKTKVQALAETIQKHLPHVEVIARAARVEQLTDDDPELFQGVSLVLFATGNPTVELVMNEQLHRDHPGQVITLHTWVEPFGLGGHALLTNLSPERKGCFECLYATRGDGAPVNAASFSAPHQTFARRLGGCTSAFVPFGGVDATRTACLAVELIRDFLEGALDDHPLRSWRGSARRFTEAGHETSPRYAMCQSALDDHPFNYKSPTCPICYPR